jgi:NADH dehydrogenase
MTTTAATPAPGVRGATSEAAARVPHVVIVGAGFGGLRVARALARAPVAVTVVDQHNYHCFLPLLYQVATAGLEPQDIAYPIRAILRRYRNVAFRMARVARADLAGRTLITERGERIGYDHLVVAAGSVTHDFGNPGVAAHAFGLHDIDDARAIRNHVLRLLERAEAMADGPERAALLTLVVVGGGPTGVELAGALAEFRRHVVPRDYRHVRADDLRVLLLEGTDRILGALPERLRQAALSDLAALGVDVRLGTLVGTLDAGAVTLADGARLATHTVIWAAGVKGPPLAAALGLPPGRGGRIAVGATLAVAGHPEVQAIGDVALVAGAEQLPQVAQVAMQQGEHAARNVVRALAGEPPLPFAYRDKGTMATIGRSRAVCHLRGLDLRGRLAWWAWLVVHIVMLIGFRNRLVVLVNWAWNYVTYDRGVRAIVGAGDGRGAP